MADTATTVDQTAKIIAGWNDRLIALADALTDAAKAHGQEAVDLAVAATRVSAGAALFDGVACLTGAVVAGIIAHWLTKKIGSLGGGDYNDAVLIPSMIGVVLVGILFVVLTLGAFFNLFDLWNWVGIFEPKLLVAHKLLKL
jgi:hypothetical protein